MIPHFASRKRPLRARAALAAIVLCSCAADGDAPTRAAGDGGGRISASTAGSKAVAETSMRPAGSVYGNYLAAQVAKSRQDLPRAARFISDALAKDPRNPELVRQAFLLQTSVGNMERALALARRMAHTDASHSAATVLRVLASVRDGDLGQARTILKSLPDQGLGQLVHPLMGAWIALAEGKDPDNVAKLADLSAIEGIELLRHVHSALIHDLSDRPDAARKAFDSATGDTDALSLRLVWLAANFYKRNGQADRAESLLDTYVEANPGSTTAKLIRDRIAAADSPARLVNDAEEGLAEALFNVAGLFNQQGASDLALLYTRLSLYMHDSHAFGRVLLGEVLNNQGRPDAALEAYRKVAQESPFRYVAQLRIASVTQELGKPADAIALLETLAAAHPDRHEPLLQMGNVHRSQEAFDKAVTAYRGALDRIGETSEQHWNLHYFLGIALERTDRWQAAEKQFKRALELRPEQPYVMNYLAYSWVEQKTNLQKAQDMLKRAIEQRPEDGFIVDSMGWVYYRLDHYDKAVHYLERAVELRPNDPVINDHLGDAYWKVGRKREARFQWRRALSLDPDKDVKSRIESKLDKGLDAVNTAADG